MTEKNKRVNLENVTFLIPLRIDSINRLENLMATIDYINTHFITNFKILEAASYNNKILQKLLPNNVECVFYEDHDPIFHRTFYINQLVDSVCSKYIAIWDSDVIINNTQIESCYNLLNTNKADFAIPYNGKFLDTTQIIREYYLKTKNFNILERNSSKMKELYNPDPVGGAFFANRVNYIQAGMENENFYGWGHEDGERVNRWLNLGYKLIKVEGCLYHLWHSRGINSSFHSSYEKSYKKSELRRLAFMSKQEITEEIKKWGKKNRNEIS